MHNNKHKFMHDNSVKNRLRGLLFRLYWIMILQKRWSYDLYTHLYALKYVKKYYKESVCLIPNLSDTMTKYLQKYFTVSSWRSW